MHPREILRATASFALSLLLFPSILSPLFQFRLICALSEDLVTISDVPLDSLNVDGALESRSEHEILEERYEPDFIGVNRGIIGRAGDEIQTLENNNSTSPQNGLQSGQTLHYVFQKGAIFGPKSPETTGLPTPLARRDDDVLENILPDELRKRQNQGRIYISLTTCSQPLPNNENTNGAAGQLQLFISFSSNKQKPDQSNYDLVVPMDGGYAGTSFTASDDVFFSVSAPGNDGFTGNYDYELTASIDDYYATYNEAPYNRIVDSDTSSVLIFTNDTTNVNTSADHFQQWMRTSAFSAYVYEQNNPAIIGIQSSWCALDKHKQIYVNSQSSNTSTTTTVDGQVKQQFYVQGLNGSSAYYAIIAIEGNSTQAGPGVVKGGGTVWASTNFRTKSDNNCKIVFNLTFCSDVGYAVPWNTTTNYRELGETYDNYTQFAYTSFNKSLQQVACNTTSSAQYSLARNCTDCAHAYKQWLCAVTMPRCEDFSNNANYLQPRAVSSKTIGNANIDTNDPILNDPKNKIRSYVNTSRSAWIDQNIMPVPYKELLPCQDLCYQLVQSCPAMLQFACPLPGFGLNYSYRAWNSTVSQFDLPPDQYQCNPMNLTVSLATNLRSNSGFGIGMTLATMVAAALF